jgi:hypothetical protein
MRVRAAVVEKKSGPLILQELDPDELRLDEVLKELSPPVVTTGICQTDGHVRNLRTIRCRCPWSLAMRGGHRRASRRRCGGCQTWRPRGDVLSTLRTLPLLARRPQHLLK